ncbi:MAG: hypothetical protein QOI95_1101 [Acidimicrobiaceae bacterium]|jgi:cytoskeletal protein RodZ
MDRRRQVIIAGGVVLALLIGLIIWLLASGSDDTKVNATASSSASAAPQTTTTTAPSTTRPNTTRPPGTTTTTTPQTTAPKVVSVTNDPVQCPSNTASPIVDIFIHWKTENAVQVDVKSPADDAPSTVDANMATYRGSFDCSTADPKTYTVVAIGAKGERSDTFKLLVTRAPS